jgi:hypothetical protein
MKIIIDRVVQLANGSTAIGIVSLTRSKQKFPTLDQIRNNKRQRNHLINNIYHQPLHHRLKQITSMAMINQIQLIKHKRHTIAFRFSMRLATICDRKQFLYSNQ